MEWRGAKAWIFLSIGDSAEAGQLAGLDTVISQAGQQPTFGADGR